MEQINKLKRYKVLFISSLLINAIILFFLFNAYDGSCNYNGVKLYFSFVFSTWIGMGLIGLVIAFEIIRKLLKKRFINVSISLFTFTWIFNLYVFIIWTISVLMKMQATRGEWWQASICFTGFIAIVIYQNKLTDSNKNPKTKNVSEVEKENTF